MPTGPNEYEIVRDSGLFDPEYYKDRYPDVAITGMDPLKHFLLVGGVLGRSPSRMFDAKYYLEANPDVKEAGISPLIHYIIGGCREGRSPIGPTSTEIPVFATVEPDVVERAPAATSAEVIRPIVFIAGEAVDKPGYQYRVARYAEAYQRCGETVIAIPRSKIAETLPDIERAKMLVIWRAAYRDDIVSAINAARTAGAAIFFDVDDLMVRPEFATADIIDAIRYDKKNPEEVAKLYTAMRRTMTSSDFCSATTHELAWHMRRYGRKRPTFVLPNGFSEQTYQLSRISARAKVNDGLIRIGYASGSRTHQADFSLCAEAVAETLRANPNARLVLFRKRTLVTLDTSEFPALKGLEDQIEWRNFVEHHDLPKEIARFDINLAPLEFGNPFVEAKSELKFFEAAICNVPSIVSPTAPFKRCMVNGENGFLAGNMDEWRNALSALVNNPELRRSIGLEAHRTALWTFGPTRRTEIAASVLDQLKPGRRNSAAFYVRAKEALVHPRRVALAEHVIKFNYDSGRPSKVTVIVPLFNYENFVVETLDSIKAQSLKELDLIVVDDLSTDKSEAVVLRWLEAHGTRFNRALLVQHTGNKGLGTSRNTAFDLADTLYVMAVDADNTLRPECCEKCFAAASSVGASFAYPTIQKFGNDTRLMGERDFYPADFVPGNGIDAMAMISKEAWSLVGGYATHRMGWQDYDFWCKIVDRGLHGVHVDEILADYRAHSTSMLSRTNKKTNKVQLLDWMEAEHPWLSLTSSERSSHHTSLPSDSE